MTFYADFVVNQGPGDDFRPTQPVFAGDFGLVLRVMVRDVDGFPLDLSGTSTPCFEFTRPDGSVLSRDGNLAGEGVVTYEFATGELNTVGHWDFSLTAGGVEWEPQRFNVRRTL